MERSSQQSEPSPPPDLPALASEQLAHLLRRLRSGRARERVAAVQALAGFPDQAIAPLCEALHDRSLVVRIAAAEALGQLADPAAAPALIAALRQPAWWPRPLHWVCATVALSPVILAGYLLNWPDLLMGGVVVSAAPVFLFLAGVQLQGRSSAWYRALAEALARISERHPLPEIGAAVPRLRQAAVDALTADHPDEWLACDAAAARIEAVTNGLERLPVSVVEHSPAVSALPTPADPENGREELPRAVDELPTPPAHNRSLAGCLSHLMDPNRPAPTNEEIDQAAEEGFAADWLEKETRIREQEAARARETTGG